MGASVIPETAMVRDILKPTGYDCPEDLIDKTFAEATAGGDEVEVESVKEVTVDVSEYSGPITIEPSSGKDAMGQVVITLTGI